MIPSRIVSGAASLVLLTLILGSSVPALGQATTLVVVQQADAETLDPTLRTGVETANVNMHIFDGLVRMSEDMKVEPMLATSWEMIDPLTWRFRLRRDVKFHNGDPFTAQDVKFTLDRILDPKVGSGLLPYVSGAKEVVVQDDYTVVLKLSEPSVTFVKQLTRGVLIVPRNAFLSMGAERFGREPIGTGPFRFLSWVRDQQLSLEANTGYWRGRPKVDRLIIRSITEPSTRVATALTGEAHIVANIPLDLISAVRINKNTRLESAGGLTQVFIAFNSFREPFKDIRVRRAVNYGLDVDQIAKTILKGYGQRLGGPFAPLSFGYDPSLKPYPYNPDLAKRLLADAGYQNGLDVEFWFQTGGGLTGVDEQIAEAIAGQLSKIGVRVKLRGFERNEWLRVLLRQPSVPHMGLADNRDALGDGDFVLSLWYHSKRRAHYYNTSELDKMIEQQLTAFDPSARLQKLRDIGRYVHDQAAVGFLASVDIFFAVNGRVKGWRPRGDRTLWVYPAWLE